MWSSPSFIFRTFLRQTNDFTQDHAAIMFYLVLGTWELELPHHSFHTPVTNRRQRDQWINGPSAAACKARWGPQRKAWQWQVLFMNLSVNNPLFCSISLALVITSFPPPHSKPQRVVIQNTSVSCFRNCNYTFTTSILIWDSEASSCICT